MSLDLPDLRVARPPFRLVETCWEHEFAGHLPAYEVRDRNGHTVARVQCAGPGHETFLRRAVRRENEAWLDEVLRP